MLYTIQVTGLNYFITAENHKLNIFDKRINYKSYKTSIKYDKKGQRSDL